MNKDCYNEELKRRISIRYKYLQEELGRKLRNGETEELREVHNELKAFCLFVYRTGLIEYLYTLCEKDYEKSNLITYIFQYEEDKSYKEITYPITNELLEKIKNQPINQALTRDYQRRKKEECCHQK